LIGGPALIARVVVCDLVTSSEKRIGRVDS
jgi:hypothetical protein